ncbi:avidin/streptavidin family protein [Paraburkholderia mimosarum]|uniref:avidin/streptavidin family protein n=1 Tax=Paraburkholderia mimosarum TaxID=312026 RepID=UPI0004186FEF|nr:avidin/streptavidin family protein [Paraburkholderia mimosarum]
MQGAKGATPELVGKWENELGSVMTIDQFDGVNFSGTYQSAVSSDGQYATGPISGTVAEDAIAFTVDWDIAYASVTSWSGLLLHNGDQACMYTLWNLSSTPEKEDDFWQSIQAGADLFAQT